MSFDAERVEVMTETWIMRVVIDFNRILRKKEYGYCYEKEHFKKDVCIVCAYVRRYSDDWLFRYGSRTL